MTTWKEVTFIDGPRSYTDDAAREWFEQHHAALLAPQSKRGRFVVVLQTDRGVIAGSDVVVYLSDLFGARFRHDPRPQHRAKEQSKIRRRLDNVIRAAPFVYSVELTVGNIDALFEPIGGGQPWKDLGVKQRLQALGYLYTPLQHPSVDAHAELCWNYYRRVKSQGQAVPIPDAQLAVHLRLEAAGNLMASEFPKPHETLRLSKLPAPSEYSILRFPGGYGATRSPTSPLVAGDLWLNNGRASNPPSKYHWRIGDPRHEIENVVFEDNPKLGRFPIIAKVKRRHPDGRETTLADVPVLFQLVDPDPAPAKFAPEPLPDKVMNYDTTGTTWVDESFPSDQAVHRGLLEPEWTAVHRITHAAVVADPNTPAATAKQWIEDWSNAIAPVPHASVSGWAPVNDVPDHLTITKPELLKADNVWVYARDPAKRATKPTPAFKYPGLTDADWASFLKLVAKADTDQPLDQKAAQTLGNGWLDAWASAPRMDWNGVQRWWGKPAQQPYPYLRTNPAWAKQRAKDIVDFLLQEKAAFKSLEVQGLGQKKFTDALFPTLADKKDPQRNNAPQKKWGGKAGAGIDKIFELPQAKEVGFHQGRPGQNPNVGELQLATKVADAGKHPHAVQCKTNAEGFAGVVFTPSRFGGDTYKIRAYVDPDWLTRNHADRNAEARTGSFAVWRNIRMNAYLRLPNPGTAFSPEMQTLLDWGATHAMPSWNPKTRASPEFAQLHLNSHLADLDLLGVDHPEPEYAAMPASKAKAMEGQKKMLYRPAAVIPAGLRRQLRRAYCELLDDSGGIKDISRDQLRAALKVGTQAWDASGTFAKRIHWPSMLVDDPTSPFLLTLRSFSQYNEVVAAENQRIEDLWSQHENYMPGGDPTYPALAGDDDPEKAVQNMVEAMLEHLSGSGVLPGFTVVQIANGQTWDKRALDIRTPITSGYGTASRGFYLAGTDRFYRDMMWLYSATSNACHEMGHALALSHQPPAGADIEAAHQPPIMQPFQAPKNDQAVCVMSYSGCYGDYCAMCLLSLRGWAQPQKKDALFV